MTPPPNPDDTPDPVHALLLRLHEPGSHDGTLATVAAVSVMVVLSGLGAVVVVVLGFVLGIGVPWVVGFLLLALVMAGLTWNEDRRTREDELGGSLRGEAVRIVPIDATHWKVVDAETSALEKLVDVLLWPPRTAAIGIRAMRGKEPPDLRRRTALAAVVVRRLLDRGAALPLAALLDITADTEELGKTLGWLDYHDHVGFSSDRRRVWLSTPFAKQLVAAGIKAGPQSPPIANAAGSVATSRDESPIPLEDGTTNERE